MTRLSGNSPSTSSVWFQRSRGLLENTEYRPCAVDAVAFRLASEGRNALRLEVIDRTLGGGERHVEPPRKPAHGPEWILDKQIERTFRGPRGVLREPPTPFGEQRVDPLDAVQNVLGLTRDTAEEVLEPLLPLSPLGNGQEPGIVLTSRRFKERTEVQKRRRQHTARNERQSDQQPPNAAIAIQEGVNRLGSGPVDRAAGGEFSALMASALLLSASKIAGFTISETATKRK